MNVLFVTKDIGGFRIARPVANVMRKRGHTVCVAAEGLSIAAWKEYGYADVLFAFKEEGFSSDAMLDIFFNTICEQIHAIIATLGEPIRIEALLSHEANKRRIPLVWLEDVWGAHIRSDAAPDMIVTLDEAGRRMIASNPRFKKTRIVIADLFPEEDLGITNEMRAHFREKTNGKLTVLLAGQGEITEKIIRFVQKSLLITRDPCQVFARFHPKYKNIWPVWEKMLGSRAFFDEDGLYTANQLAALCDITVSSYSTVLRIAARHRHLPVSVSTPETRKAMRMSAGYEQYPLVSIKSAIEISEPMDFAHLLHKNLVFVQNAQKHNENTTKGAHAVSLVADTIQQLVSIQK
jgi:hypothetical protein